MSFIDLGFAEECEPWQVESYQFPSKIGGKPAWLNLQNLPKVEELQCNSCKQVMVFLCQVYAPYEDDDNNFHRTLFVFICRNSSCSIRNCSNNVKVFRNSLKRLNQFYSFDPPKEKQDNDFNINKWTQLCNLCGCLGDKHCGKCKKAYYCCREHQILDWKERHKAECTQLPTKNCINSKILFPEYEMVIENEELRQTNSNEKDELENYSKLVKEGKAGTMQNVSESELESLATSAKDKVFWKFQKRIKQNCEQVLRYDRGGDCLWIADGPFPQIPNCENCGGPRQFEFQIMPQMLTVLKESMLDWGVIAVYSCVKSCSSDKAYLNEFAFKQDVSNDNEF